MYNTWIKWVPSHNSKSKVISKIFLDDKLMLYVSLLKGRGGPGEEKKIIYSRFNSNQKLIQGISWRQWLKRKKLVQVIICIICKRYNNSAYMFGFGSCSYYITCLYTERQWKKIFIMRRRICYMHYYTTIKRVGLMLASLL